MAVFWLRSVRRRRAAFVVLTLVAALGVAVAVLPPLLLRAVQESAVARAAQEAGAAGTAVFGFADTQPLDASGGIAAAVGIAEGAGAPYLWRSSTFVTESNAEIEWRVPGSAARTARFTGVGSDCGGLAPSEGRCAAREGEVVVPASSGVPIGTRIVTRGDRTVRFTVVGRYSDTRAFAAGPRRFAGVAAAAGPDLVVSAAGFDALRTEGTAVAVRVLAHRLRLEDVPDARAGVAGAADAALSSSGAATGGRAIARIGSVLDGVQPGLDAAGVLLGLVALDALVLAWFATGSVVQRLGRSRAPEWGLARLRGLPARRRLGAALLEPGIATLLGAVFGAGLGLALAAAVAPAPLAPLRAEVLGAFGLALGGSIVALVGATARSTRAPLGALLRSTTEPRRASRAAVAVQVAAVLLAGTALQSLATGTGLRADGVSSLAPLLLALVVAIVGIRVAAAVLARPGGRAPRSAVRLLARRRLGRSPSVLTGAAAVLVGVAVAAFAAQLAASAALAQHDRAAAQVGAATVLRVTVPQGTSLRSAVDAADPSGRVAMAAAELPRGAGVGRLIGVDTARFAAVTSWKEAWGGRSSAALARALDPPAAAPLVLTGTSLRLRLDHVNGGRLPSVPSLTRLRAVVETQRTWRTVELGAPHDGLLRAAIPCTAGCRLVALEAVYAGANGAAFSLGLTITGIGTERGDADDRLVAGEWRNRLGAVSDPSQPARAAVSDGDPGLLVAFEDVAGGLAPGIAVQDVPEPIPVLIGPATETVPFAGVDGAVSGIGFSEETRLLRPIGTAAVLPRFLGDGALANLSVVERSSDPSASVAVQEVWLSPGEHPQVLARLRAEGVRITGTTTLAATEARLDRDAPALAAAVAPLIGLVAVLLVLLARLGGGLLDAPARRADTTAIRLAGLPRRAVRRAAAAEVALPLGVAVVAGAVVGPVAFLLVAPHLSLVAAAGVSPPLDTGAAVVPLVLTALTALLLAALVTGAVVRAEVPREEDR